MLEGREIEGIFTDNGIVRTSTFGIPWLIFYFILIFKSSKNKLLPIVWYLTILHYPIAFGIVNTAIIGISLNYFNKITMLKNNEKKLFHYDKISYDRSHSELRLKMYLSE